MNKPEKIISGINPQEIILETTRMKVFPLVYHQLVKYVLNDGSLETELGLNYERRNLHTDLTEALEQTILPAVRNGTKNFLYSTLWVTIIKEKNVLAGSLCFKGEPNDKGEIEIGYGIDDDFQNKGYMTEAIRIISSWAFGQNEISAIIAETDKENISSHKVLQKNNFYSYKETEKMLWWRLNKDQSNSL